MRWMGAAAIGLLILSGCGDRGLHLSIHYRDAHGLKPGAPVVKEATAIGAVEAIEADPAGGYLVSIRIDDKFATAATAASRFYLAEQPRDPGQMRIEVEQPEPGGALLADGSTVEGSERSPGLPTIDELFRQFGEGVKTLRGQLEQFREDLRKAPDSPEAKRLQEEWQRLTEEMKKSQTQAEESFKRDVLPRLQQELDRLKDRLREFQSQPLPEKKEPRPI